MVFSSIWTIAQQWKDCTTLYARWMTTSNRSRRDDMGHLKVINTMWWMFKTGGTTYFLHVQNEKNQNLHIPTHKCTIFTKYLHHTAMLLNLTNIYQNLTWKKGASNMKSRHWYGCGAAHRKHRSSSLTRALVKENAMLPLSGGRK